MIPTPGSRVQSSETVGARSQIPTPTQTTTDDDEPPSPEPDPMPFPPVDNPLPEGEEEDIALEEELARQAGRVYLRWDGVRKGTTKITWVFENYYKWFVPQFSMAPPHAVEFWWDRWRITFSTSLAFFRLQRGYEYMIYESWRMRVAKRLREIMHGIRNKGARHGSTTGIGHPQRVDHFTPGAPPRTRPPERGCEVFARTHTRKEDREWVDKRSSDVNDAYDAELKRLQDERQAIIVAGGPEPPPPIDEVAGDYTTGGGACLEGSCCGGHLRGEGADLGVPRVDAVARGLRLEESLLRHVQLLDSDAEWRLRCDARHASPTASTATTASCSITNSPTTT
ncbi:hypothetical protein PIB30_033650 [Stylosanthes scabra]|uniref:Uncharacterized protein n=1 Tax=Stylosanthes scabra TaxID=79078 RepID=A0ABU6TEG7_9FABA|nr:hypothetical protein [Stylosanthes scabra]